MTTALKKKAKVKPEKLDGLSADDIKKIRSAIRQVWSWSHPRRLVVKRCLTVDGFSICEKCHEEVPKIHVDHIDNVGDVDEGFIARLFVSSDKLQGLCKKCHNAKTNQERKDQRLKSKVA